MTNSGGTTTVMAIGRNKTNSKVLGLVSLIAILLTFRLLWEVVTSRPMKTIIEPNYYPVEVEEGNLLYENIQDTTREHKDDDVVMVGDILLGALKPDPRVVESIVEINIPQKSSNAPVTTSVVIIADNENSSLNLEKDRIKGKIATKDTERKSSKTIKDDTSVKVNEASKQTVRVSATASNISENVLPAHVETIKDMHKESVETTKGTSKHNKIVVTENTDNVVVFTKEQLNYGKVVDAEEKKIGSRTKKNESDVRSNTTSKPKQLSSPISIAVKTNGESFKTNTHITNNGSLKIDTAKLKDDPIRNTKIEAKDETVKSSLLKLKEEHRPHSTFREVPLSEAQSFGQCKKVIPWGQKYHAKLSTFDLPKKGNYTVIDDMGNYPLPVKTVAEVTDRKTLEPVTVILVPFSHADPGYGLTIEQYYNTKTHSTLDNMISKLLKYPDLTFQWAETVYLARWFKDLTEDKKKQVRQLISRGQLEIVLGGWVMPDEASSRYVGVVDQLIEGHQWLIENLQVKPKNAWVNDPFGYSSTMPYLWKSSGMDNLVFLRINQAVKAQLMKSKSMDFKWRPYWKTDNSSDVLSSLMAYTNYWIGDVCSPDRDTCNEFGFIHLDEKQHRAIEITDENLEKQAEKLHGMFRVTADLYKYNTLYIGLGEDFTYVRAAEWDNLYKNYDKLINYINGKNDWKMNIKFGNLTEYFNHVKQIAHEKVSQSGSSTLDSPDLFPTISGDFYPYTEKNQEYWTGYYTTRPLNKRFSREIESLVHATDAFNVMLYSIFKYYNVKYEGYTTVSENLRTARRELGMFLHHDGITGTSLPHVVRDFEWRLMKAYESVHTAFKTVLTTMLTKGSFHFSKLLQEETVKAGPRQISKKIVIQVDGEGNKMVLVNSIGRSRSELVSVYVNSKNVNIVSANKPIVPFQTAVMKDQGLVMVTFMANLPAYGIEVYKIVPTNKEDTTTLVQQRYADDVLFGAESTLTIENTHIKVLFDKTTGMIKQVLDKKSGHTTDVISAFLVYRSAKSGAYIFGPAGPAVPFTTGKTVVTVTKGHLMSEVKVKSPGFMLSIVLYNTSAIQGQGLHIKTEVDMKAVGMKNMEVVLRFSTSIKNGAHFFTDQNGYQLMGRKTDYNSKIETNYYPITTMVILEDNTRRVTLHTKQPHGAASLQEGQLEVMLDRHTFRDDGRGLGQGVYDNVNVNSEFVLQIEHKSVPSDLEEVRYTYSTQDAVLLNDALQNNLFIYSVNDNNIKISDKIHPIKDRQIPCDVTVVGLRNLVKNNLEYNGTSLVLHRHSFQCGYQSSNNECNNHMGDKFTIKSLLPKLKVGVTETSLSHLHVINNCDMTTDLKPQHMELRAFKIDI